MRIKKRKGKTLCSLAVFCGMCAWSCGQDVEQQITMTTKALQIHLRGAFAHDEAQATVDWGDGTKDFVTGSSLANYAFGANHRYVGETIRTITIRSAFLCELDCSHNQLTSLDVSKHTALNILFCSENQLAALDVRANTALTALHCEENRLAALDVSRNTKLNHLWCHTNRLTALDVSANTALIKLWCSGNQLAALELGRNTELTSLWCADNKFTRLDVSANTKLVELYCDNNQLTALDLSANPALFELLCNKNRLTALDVSANPALTFLWCHNNPLTESALHVLFESLPKRDGNMKGHLRSDSSPQHDSLITDKGWERMVD